MHDHDQRFKPGSGAVSQGMINMGSIAGIDAETEKAVRVFIEKVANQYDLAGAILFGSCARKSHRPDSDADVAVLLRGRRGPFLDAKLDIGHMAYDVLLKTSVLIQPLPVWEAE